METKDITLPVSGQKVTLRNYTTHADDLAYENELYEGVSVDQEADADPTKPSKEKMKIAFPMANMMNAKRTYVQNLIVGDLDVNTLPTKDYDFLELEVDKIVDEHSPKVQKGKQS